MELQRIKLLDDRTQYPRVRVLIDVEYEERICLYINEKGRAVVVIKSDEEAFLNHDKYATMTYRVWEEIKQPTYRPYMEGDNIDHLLGEKVKIKGRKVKHLITGLNEDPLVYPVKVAEEWISFEFLFGAYEFLDGTPIGVKE